MFKKVAENMQPDICELIRARLVAVQANRLIAHMKKSHKLLQENCGTHNPDSIAISKIPMSLINDLNGLN